MRYLKVILLFVLIALGWQKANAYDFKVSGICYNKNDDGTSVTVTYERTSSPRYSNLNGALNIPETVTYNGTTYSVTSIGKFAFYGCTGLTSVTIPNSVTTIDSDVFDYCTGLTRVNISDLAAWCNINFSGYGSNPLFQAHNLYINGSQVTNLEIPNSISAIKNYAFYGCTGLTSVNLHNSITSIGDYAFSGTSLTSVTITNSITSIGSHTFEGCANLTSITIPNSITDIGSNAFAVCNEMSSVYISDLNAWCNINFADQSANPLSQAQSFYLNGNKVVNLVIPNFVEVIKSYAFSGFSGFTSVTIPNSVTSIKKDAFSGCIGLTSVTIGNSVISIGENAFLGCSDLTSVHLGNSVELIGSRAFYNCKNLESLTIPNSVTQINAYAFYNCNNITGDLIIPNSVTSIGDYAFYNLLSLSGVLSIGNSVTSIGNYAFYQCHFDDIIIGSSLRIIGNYAFYNCGSLINLVLPNSLKKISSYSFAYCRNLESVVIPESVNQIYDYAFEGCTGLMNIYSKIENPNNVTLGTLVFRYVNHTSCILIVPNDAISLYKNAEQWKSFSNIKPFVSSVSLNMAQLSLFCGQTATLVATVLPSTAYNNTLRWVSSNTNVASVDENGNVIAKNIGSTTISAYTTDNSNLSTTCEVNVVIPVSSVSLNQTSVDILKNSTINLIATVLPENAYNKTLSWKSNKTNVATVDQNGKVIAKAVGTATITATTTDGTNLSASCEIHVYNVATSITLNETQTTLNVGESETLTATISPSNTLAHQFPIQWTSSNNNVATVDSTGKITAIRNGTAIITASTTDGSNLSATCQVTVRTLATSIALDRSQIIMYKNDFDALTATILPETTSNKNVSWASSNNSIVSVDNAGNINAKATGIATITATTTDGTNLSASCQVQVYNRVSSVTLNYTSLVLEKGQHKIISATIYPSNAYNKNLLWSSSNPAVAEVVDTMGIAGVVTAKSVGNAIISATTTDGSNITATCNVEVIVYANAVNLNKHETSIYAGGTEQLTAQVLPEDADDKNVTWRSSNSNIASVSSNGLVTANKVGTALIIATCNEISDTCVVNVNGITNITLNKTETSIYAGGTEQLNANFTPSDVINRVLTWTSSNTNVATVNQNGLVTANKVGNATITATATDGSEVSASCVVNVNGITSIYLNKSTTSIYIGESENLTATIIPSDVINKTLIWSSSNINIATVDQNGTVTAMTVGTAIITATTTDGTNLSASCEVTVLPFYDLYPTTTEITHIRGQSNFSIVIPFWMSNKTAISGLQFDITLPTGVSFATVDDYPDVWLDPTRKARNHSVDVNLISGSKYRVLVSSPTNNTFKGNEGVVLYMRFNIDRLHPVGTYYINTSNVIFVEPDETQHFIYNKSVKINYKYLLGDADADAKVDIADYTVTALYILNRPTEVFYSDAANVSGNNGINVTDLVGITNISLGIRPYEYRPAPAVTMDNDTQESMPSLNASMEGDNIVALSIENDTPLAGIQLDLQLPQGMALADATLEGRAAEYQLGTNTLADGSVRLLISSFDDKDIEAGNDAVIKLVLEGNNVNNEMLYITGVQAASRDLRSFELNDITMPVGTTSIDDIGYSYDKLSVYGKGNTIVVNSPSAMLIQVVHVNGMVIPVEIKPGHNTIDVGGHGVYIIRVGNSAFKVRL